MVLVLKNHQMENLLPMAEEIDAIELAFRELGQGKAMLAPRARLRTPWKEEGGQYYFNNIMGLGARHEVDGAAHRLELLERNPSRRQQAARLSRRFHRPGDALRHGHLQYLGDHGRSLHLGHARRRHQRGGEQLLARKDAKVMALLGSGEQAKTQVTAHACVRQLTKVKVYSPTKANREKFAKEVSAETGIEVVPTNSAEEAIRGSDIVTAATNTVDPVILGKWIEPGMHLNSIVGGDGFLPRKELDDEAVMKANLIVVGYKQQIFLDKQAEFHDRLERGLVKAEDLHELGDLVNGNCRGRQSDKEITFFKNNTGMGIQFAVTARKMYDKAKEKGIGTELPLELFMTQRGDKLFSP